MLVGTVSPLVTFSAQGPCSVPTSACGIVMAVEEPTINTLQTTVYPNPSAGFVTIAFNNNEAADFTMFSLDGKQVLQKQIHNGEEIDLSTLPAGMYTYVLYNAMARATGRLVVQ